MVRALFVFVAALGVTLFGGCGPATVGMPGVEVPPPATSYSTDAGSNGVRGGRVASEAEDLLEKQLAGRGQKAEPDRALADTAAWILRLAYQKNGSMPTGWNDAALRFGFVGQYYGGIVDSLAGRGARTIETLVAAVPNDAIVNRYGIVAGQGSDVAVVLGSVEVSLDEFPRSLAPGATIRLSGEVSERYQSASVFSTNPAGKVRKLPITARKIDAAIVFPDAGVHQLEVIGYGTMGPAVLLNVPIHVGVSADVAAEPSREVDPNLTVEEAESMLLSLLNEERSKHGVAKVEPDQELRAVAVAHSSDMVEHHFISHISPTTGGPGKRVAKARLRVSNVGECIALESTPAGAHRGLLNSPAHRATMLNPSFTHVGVGVSFDDQVTEGPRRMYVTQLFGRRPSPNDVRMGSAELIELIQSQRRARKLAALRVDPVLTAAAGVAIRALTSGSAKTPEEALAISGREVQAAANRRSAGRGCQTYEEIIDRYQLAEIELLKHADIRSIGIAAAPIESEIGTKLAVIVIAEPGPGKVTPCN
jgi:uncharacterized protein YkwD